MKVKFFWIIIFITVINVFLTNDLLIFWDFELPSVSRHFAWDDFFGESHLYLFTLIQTASVGQLGATEWAYRIPAVMTLVAVGVIIFYYSKKLLGNSSAEYLLGVLFTFPAFLMLGKIANPDVLYLLYAVLVFFYQVLFLKQAIEKWRRAYFITILLGAVFLGIWQVLIFPVGLWVGFNFSKQHKEKNKKLKPYWIWLLALGILVAKAALTEDYYLDESLFVSLARLDILRYLGLLLLGTCLWWAMLPFSIWHTFRQAKKGEELSVIVAVCLIAGLLSMSVVVLVPLGIAVAKQIQKISASKFTYLSGLKVTTILGVVLVFLLTFLSIFRTIEVFGGIGFWSLSITSILLWGGGVVALVGLYSKNYNYYIKSSLFTNALAITLFLSLMMPLLEGQRSLPKRLSERIADLKENTKEQPYLFLPSIDTGDNLSFYMNKNVKTFNISKTELSPIDSVDYQVIMKQPKEVAAPTTDSLGTVEGWYGGKFVKFYLYR